MSNKAKPPQAVTLTTYQQLLAAQILADLDEFESGGEVDMARTKACAEELLQVEFDVRQLAPDDRHLVLTASLDQVIAGLRLLAQH